MNSNSRSLICAAKYIFSMKEYKKIIRQASFCCIVYRDNINDNNKQLIRRDMLPLVIVSTKFRPRSSYFPIIINRFQQISTGQNICFGTKVKIFIGYYIIVFGKLVGRNSSLTLLIQKYIEQSLEITTTLTSDYWKPIPKNHSQ